MSFLEVQDHSHCDLERWIEEPHFHTSIGRRSSLVTKLIMIMRVMSKKRRRRRRA